MQIKEKELKKFYELVGKTIYITTFLSTTKDKGAAFKGNVLLEIETIDEEKMKNLKFN